MARVKELAAGSDTYTGPRGGGAGRRSPHPPPSHRDGNVSTLVASGSNVTKLVAMGFDAIAAKAALLAHKGDLQAAMDWLLGI